MATTELQKLEEVYKMGFILEEEYERRKQELMSMNQAPPVASTPAPSDISSSASAAAAKKPPQPVSKVVTPKASDTVPPPMIARLNIPESELVAFTTCVLMPPRDQLAFLPLCSASSNKWGAFVEIKRHHMNPRIKRPPYPHITLLAPFVRPSRFGEVKAAFAKALEGLQPFEIRFSRFKAFERGTSSTIYLEPEVEPSNALADLYGILTRVLPPSSSAAPFEPHIGIGYFKNIREAAELQKKYQAGWKPIKFLAKEIYFLSRSSQDDPWQVQAVVPLGGGRSTDRPYFEIGETTDSK